MFENENLCKMCDRTEETASIFNMRQEDYMS